MKPHTRSTHILPSHFVDAFGNLKVFSMDPTILQQDIPFNCTEMLMLIFKEKLRRFTL